MSTSSPVERKKVILLSRHSTNILIELIKIIRHAGCDIVLLVTALGYYYLLNDQNYDGLAERIKTIYKSVEDPPAVLTISGMSQLLPHLNALDPDLVITANFPYQLTPAILAHRSAKINAHPTFLPLFRGSSVYYSALKQQLPTWGITWHYITEQYDAGNILVQKSFDMKIPYTFPDIAAASYRAILETAAEAICMVFSGNPGIPQRELTADEADMAYAKAPNIHERTIKSGLTCHEVWKLVEACKLVLPAILEVDGRLYQVIEASRLQTPIPDLIQIGQIKRKFNRFVQQCTDGQMEYIVRII